MLRYPNLPVMRLCVEGRATDVRVYHAHSFLARLFGLLGRRPLAAGEALWLQPCTSVHTLGMRYPIDVVFLDRGGRVLVTRDALAPSKLAAARRARCAVELPQHAAGQLGITPGKVLSMEAA
jgi:uncharacterized membrane protein (UPF0127 family)